MPPNPRRNVPPHVDYGMDPSPAASYLNEDAVGRGIRRSGVARGTLAAFERSWRRVWRVACHGSLVWGGEGQGDRRLELPA